MTEPSKPAMTMRQIREGLGHDQHPADNHDAVPPAWVDGDPLMEAIAAAIWEHCETDGPSLVVDDPRNIAATAAAVARASSSAPADRDAARERIAAAIYEHMHPGSYWSDTSMPADWRPAYLEEADAVLAVLPAPAETEFELRGTAANRAAAFDEAANALAALGPEDSLVSGAKAWVEAVETLRRLAGEARDERETQATQPKRPPMDPVHILGIGAPATVAQQPQATDGDRIVAYQSPGGTALFCTRHRDGLSPYWLPVFSEDLPDGGICAHSTCGADLLIPQQPEAAEGAQQ